MKTNAQVWAERKAAGLNKFDVANEVVKQAVIAGFVERKEKFDEEQARLTKHSKGRAAAVKAVVVKVDEAAAATEEAATEEAAPDAETVTTGRSRKVK